MNITRLIFSSLVFFLFACGNSLQNNSTTKAIVKMDSTKIVDSIKAENKQWISFSKSLDELLKSGKKGVFEDSTFSVIIEDDFAVGITNPAFHNYEGYINCTYQVTSYLKESNNWKVQETKSITSDSSKYKSRGSDVKIEDMDGDGRKDFMLLTYGDGRGSNYKLFLIKSKKFVEVEDFEELTTPVYDKKAKIIVSSASWSGGHSTGLYQIDNDSLIFIEETSYVFDRIGDSFKITKAKGKEK